VTLIAIAFPILAITGAIFVLFYLLPRKVSRLKRQEASYRANPALHPHGWKLVKKEVPYAAIGIVLILVGALSHQWGLVVFLAIAAPIGIGFDFYRSERRHREAQQR
jgi:hypothetical protein